MGERTFFSGKTLEKAVIMAASYHGVDPDALAYKKIEKKHGFLKAPRGIVIKVDPKQPTRVKEEVKEEGAPEAAESAAPSEQMPASHAAEVKEPEESVAPAAEETADPVPQPEDVQIEAAVADAPEAAVEAAEEDSEDDFAEEDDEDDEDDEDEEDEEAQDAATVASSPAPRRRSSRRRERVELTGEIAESASGWLEKLFDLASLDLTAELYEGEGRFEVDLSGPDSALVVEDEAQVLRSIQHLLPRLMHADIGRLLHCRVDCDSYQQEREEELQDLAERTASEVVDRGRSKTLPPMHPADRRVVHLALADDPDVETESVGTGYFKRVQIRLR